jgi:ABC-2 type transport system ATP-binding protein
MVAPEIAPARPLVGSGDVVLRVRNLSKQYGKRLAVNGLNLDVFRGDIFGFLGPNGAGKTTTIRMALGLVAPTAGTVEVLGYDIATHAAAVLPRVGALVETPALYLYMSGRDNLRAMSQSLGNVGDTRVDAALAQVGLAGRQNDRVRTYSLGMKQRLGVAMALMNDPDLLVLDEPANGLDPAGIVEMRELLRALARQGKTIVISSHVLGEVQQLCTRVGIINLGQLVTEARPEELTQNTGLYVVYVENAPAALAAIQTQPWGASARMDMNGVILSPSPDGRGRSLNQFLVSAGYVPDSIIYQSESLEQAFLRLTGATAPGGIQ